MSDLKLSSILLKQNLLILTVNSKNIAKLRVKIPRRKAIENDSALLSLKIK